MNTNTDNFISLSPLQLHGIMRKKEVVAKIPGSVKRFMELWLRQLSSSHHEG